MSSPDNIPYVVINRETMKFVGRTSTMEAACMIANLEPVDASYVMIPLDLKSRMAKFGILELVLLYKNTTGGDRPNGIYDYAAMIKECYDLANQIPMDARSIFDLEKASAALPKAPVAPLPKLPPNIIRADPNAAPYIPPAPIVKGPTIPKAPGVAPSKGSTGKVWEIADLVRAEMGNAPISKEMRTAIIARCELQGINGGTAATQYGKWKATQS